MDEKTFVRPSFGENAALGCQYDARSDTFLNYSGILESTKAETLIKTEDKTTKVFKTIPNDTWANLFSGLDIPMNSRLSILSGMITLNGLKRCFADAPDEAGESKALLMYQINTATEYIDILSDEMRPLILMDAVGQSKATHIVVKTNWGSTCFISLKAADAQDVSKKDMEAVIAHLNSVLTNGNNDSENSIPNNCLELITISLHSDIFADEKVFGNFEELKTFLNAMPDLISEVNNGKGNILSHEMIPITKLADKFDLNLTGDATPNGISEDITSNVVQSFDDILLMKRQVKYIEAQVKEDEFGLSKVIMEMISKLKSDLVAMDKSLKPNVTRSIISVRAGEADQCAMEAILNAFQSEMNSLKRLQKKCNNHILKSNEKLILMDNFKSKNVSFVLTQGLLDKLCISNAGKNIYLLIYNSSAALKDSQHWKNHMKAFLNLIEATADQQDVGFAFLDNDIVDNPSLKTIAIHHLKDNAIISRDVYGEVQKIAGLCLAYSIEINPKFKKSSKRGKVLLKCPWSFRENDQCFKEKHAWQCKNCHDFLQYGFDDHFYCSCGGAPSMSYKFKCKDIEKHELRYTSFMDKRHLATLLQEIQPYEELNIVILGETGVGKSTWINGFANYLTYDTLEMALNDKPLCLIPTSFTMRDKNKGKSVAIKMGGESQNEANTDGQSATQMPMSYIFFVGETRVCLIDTPGIGDTRGIKQDRINFQNIMSHLAFVKEIHGICILLKPNNARLSVMFQFCIQELLTHLHKDACRNIVFVFTNARNTFYSAGDTFPLLETLLKEKIKGAIKLDENTEYYMDNESVRFLAAKRYGIDFPEDEFDIYAKSWEKAVTENRRLITHISNLPAHNTSDTRSLNEARRLILELTKPLAEISKNIQDNITMIERKKTEIEAMDKNKEDLFERLYIPHINLQTQPIPYPRTVCTSKSCIDVITDEEGNKTVDYKTWCHERCRLKNIVIQQYPIPELQRCSAMDIDGHCTHCGCLWKFHMHITYSTKQVSTKIIDKNVEQKIKSELDAITVVSRFIEASNKRVKEFAEEQKQINETAAKFGNFLKSNAITPYNDATANYLKYEISIEEGLVGKGSGSARLSSLQDLLKNYEQEVKILEEKMSNAKETTSFSSEDIQKMISKLFELPLNGKDLKNMMNVAGNADYKMAEEQAVVHEGGSRKGNDKSHLSKAIHFAKKTYENVKKRL